MIPTASTTEVDGSLGITPATSGLMMAIVGPSSSGPIATPAAFARTKDIVSNYGSGPAVEAAAYAIERVGKPVVFVRVDADTVGSYGTLHVTRTGTSVPTEDASTHPDDDYEAVITFMADGTIGVAGATYQYSLDGGRTMSATTALGTADHIIIPNSGGVRINFAAGTVKAGDTMNWRCIAPAWDSTDLDEAISALASSVLGWDFFQVVGPIDNTSAGTIAAQLTAMHAAGKHKSGIGNFRMPNEGETEAQYKTAFDAAFGTFADTSFVLCAGASKTLSSISRRQYRRPAVFSVAARASKVSEELDIAELDLGPLDGVKIRDANGNPDEHDEANNPGLDDSRACTLRSVEGYQGVYVTNPRIISATGSDFLFWQHRRVMNIGRSVLDAFMARRLSKAVRVGKNGFILETEAKDIEAQANALLRQALLTKPKASSVVFTLSRTDPILTPPFPLTGQMRIVPLAYPKAITTECGWNNPSLRSAAT